MIRKIDESSITKGAWRSAGFISEASQTDSPSATMPNRTDIDEADERLDLAAGIGARPQPQQQPAESTIPFSAMLPAASIPARQPSPP